VRAHDADLLKLLAIEALAAPDGPDLPEGDEDLDG
jgi:hypothetical protein